MNEDEGLKRLPGEAHAAIWLAVLAWIRLACGLAVAALADFVSPAGRMLAIAFVAYGLLLLLSRRLRRAIFSSLLADALWFLGLAHQASPTGWVAAVLVVYLMASAVALHRWREICLVSGVCAAFLIARHWQAPWESWPAELGLPVLGVVAGLRKRQLEQRLAACTAQAARLGREAEEVRLAERQRIAADFHDGPLQEFIGLVLRLEVAKKLLQRDVAAAARELDEVHRLAQGQVQDLRAFLRGIRPLELERTGLVAALEQTVQDFQKNNTIAVSFSHGGKADGVSPERSRELVQILREALHNVQKHSQATRAAVALVQSRGWVELSVEDNGTGLDFSGPFELEELEALGLGPKSIMRRVRALGGSLTVDSRPGRGTRLCLRVPA
jgi:signal transduction histidine kinase